MALLFLRITLVHATRKPSKEVTLCTIVALLGLSTTVRKFVFGSITGFLSYQEFDPGHP